MIDITGWQPLAKLVILLSPFVIGMPGLVLSAVSTLTNDYGIACSAITSNPYFESIKRAWGSGSFKWRWMTLCTVSGLVAFPWLVLRMGQLDVGELNAFPRKLKRRLKISAWLIMTGFIWMVVVWALFKFK
ncbi:hypothetical protein PPUN109347_35150 [Pseudomonas putida]|nr:hypothetical protein PPUN109347_35150 [Pseudomonas putida]